MLKLRRGLGVAAWSVASTSMSSSCLSPNSAGVSFSPDSTAASALTLPLPFGRGISVISVGIGSKHHFQFQLSKLKLKYTRSMHTTVYTYTQSALAKCTMKFHSSFSHVIACGPNGCLFVFKSDMVFGKFLF